MLLASYENSLFAENGDAAQDGAECMETDEKVRP